MIEHRYLYGDDADGNRGITVTDAELDDSPEEREYIAQCIVNDILDCMGMTFITIESESGQEHEFEVNTIDYAREIAAEFLRRA